MTLVLTDEEADKINQEIVAMRVAKIECERQKKRRLEHAQEHESPQSLHGPEARRQVRRLRRQDCTKRHRQGVGNREEAEGEEVIESCETCRFFIKAMAGHTECRFGPPVIRVTLLSRETNPSLGPGCVNEFETVCYEHPRPEKNDWCGRYEGKK